MASTDPCGVSTLITVNGGRPVKSKPSLAARIAGSSHDVMVPVRMPATISGVMTTPSRPMTL